MAATGPCGYFKGQIIPQTAGSSSAVMRAMCVWTSHVVGYGGGALAVIDGGKINKIGEVRLPAHPEDFQLDIGTGHAYVNVPNARNIAVADLSSGKVIALWPVGGASANFPMALDSDTNHVLAVFRNPPKLGVFDKQDGSIVRMADACGDAVADAPPPCPASAGAPLPHAHRSDRRATARAAAMFCARVVIPVNSPECKGATARCRPARACRPTRCPAPSRRRRS